MGLLGPGAPRSPQGPNQPKSVASTLGNCWQHSGLAQASSAQHRPQATPAWPLTHPALSNTPSATLPTWLLALVPQWSALGSPVRPSEGLHSLDPPSMWKYPPFLSKSTTRPSSASLTAPHSPVLRLPLTWGSSSGLHPSSLFCCSPGTNSSPSRYHLCELQLCAGHFYLDVPLALQIHQV